MLLSIVRLTWVISATLHIIAIENYCLYVRIFNPHFPQHHRLSFWHLSPKTHSEVQPTDTSTARLHYLLLFSYSQITAGTMKVIHNIKE